MRKAEEMAEYCYQNRTDYRFWIFHPSRKDTIRNFRLIEENLLPDEDAAFCFTGTYNGKTYIMQNAVYAYAVTNKRLLIAKKLIGGVFFQTAFLDALNDVSVSADTLLGVIEIRTTEGVITAMTRKKSAYNILGKLQNALQQAKEKDG